MRAEFLFFIRPYYFMLRLVDRNSVFFLSSVERAIQFCVSHLLIKYILLTLF